MTMMELNISRRWKFSFRFMKLL